MRIDIKMEKMSQKALERKSNKPIMEKKRRARINHCLNQLKALILEADNERSRHSKLEKADILEMTVKYLQTFRAYHVHVQQMNQLQQQSQLQQHLQQQQVAAALGVATGAMPPVSHHQMQQQATRGGGSSTNSSPSPPINLSQLPLQLQLQLQAAVQSVPLSSASSESSSSPDIQNTSTTSSSKLAPSSNPISSHHRQQQQHHLNQHLNNLSLSHLNHLNLNHHHHHHQMALHTAHQPQQISPTWRPW